MKRPYLEITVPVKDEDSDHWPWVGGALLRGCDLRQYEGEMGQKSADVMSHFEVWRENKEECEHWSWAYSADSTKVYMAHTKAIETTAEAM